MRVYSSPGAALRSEIVAACLGFIRSAWGRELTEDAVVLPAHCADAAVSLKKPELQGVEPRCFETPGEPFRRVFICDGCICFELSAYFLERACKAAEALPAFEMPERIALPADGCAADEETCAYACALLYCALKSGRPNIDCRESRGALLRCLMPEKNGAAPAVCSVLAACERGSIGGAWALACLKTLAYRDNNNLE